MRKDWSALDERVHRLISRFGAAACGAELVCDGALCGHITAAARVYSPDRTRILQIWSAKNERWELPGAHGEENLDLHEVARREVCRALGFPIDSELRGGEAVGAQAEDIAEYWNTPAHTHLAVVFEFQAEEHQELPRGAQWFDAEPNS